MLYHDPIRRSHPFVLVVLLTMNVNTAGHGIGVCGGQHTQLEQFVAVHLCGSLDYQRDDTQNGPTKYVCVCVRVCVCLVARSSATSARVAPLTYGCWCPVEVKRSCRCAVITSAHSLQCLSETINVCPTALSTPHSSNARLQQVCRIYVTCSARWCVIFISTINIVACAFCGRCM